MSSFLFFVLIVKKSNLSLLQNNINKNYWIKQKM